ncbi:response regulator transcription factor [Nonomuraea sp. NPDC048882]|uniref:response regulator transcription factor n=1 Tax=unclassified Nonomuraea TaxID=2593643 RepID=UPI0033BFF24D
MSITVLLADDQPMIRACLRLILEDQQDIRVIAEAGDGAEAIAMARRQRPDVCLVDVQMPGPDGVEVTAALAGPGVRDPLRVIVLTTFDLDEYVYGALRGGAAGFVLKDAGPELLVEAVRAAHAGEAFISPSVAPRLLRHLTATMPGPEAGGPAQPLSGREVEVTRAVARGRTNREIGAELCISLSTVKGHVAAVQAKLGLRNRVEIVAWAYGSGLLR